MSWICQVPAQPTGNTALSPGPMSCGSPPSGVTVAAAGGAGMMWGPGVARAAADLAQTGFSAVVDTTGLGLDRFDERGRSKIPTDPIALPFPQSA